MNIQYYVGMLKPDASEILARGPWSFDLAQKFKATMEDYAGNIFYRPDITFILIPDIVEYTVELTDAPTWVEGVTNA